VVAKRRLEAVAHQLPGPAHLLRAAPLVELAGGLHPVLVIGQRRPDAVEPVAGEARAGQHRHVPTTVGVAAQHANGPGQLARRRARIRLARTVGLVDGDDVGDLEDPALDALQLVAGTRQRQEQERVDHLGDGDLGLPDAHRLDQHDVVAPRLDDHHRLTGGLGDAAQGS
jgi:hypothetical protein